MATEEEIKIKITADTSEFKKEMKDAAKATEDLNKSSGAAGGGGGKKGFNATMKDTSKTTEGVKDKFKGIGKEGKKSGGILSKAFGGLKDGFMKMGASSKLATAGAVGIAIAAVGIIGKLLVTIGKKIKDVSGQMYKMFDSVGYEKATSEMNKSLTKMKTTLGAVLEPLYKVMTGIIGGLADAFNGVLETILKIYAAFVGFIGLSGTLAKSAEDYSDAMEEATASADAGLASFDKLNTLNTDGMGDAAQAENIRNMMAETAASADAFRNAMFDALNPVKCISEFFDSMHLDDIWKDFTTSATKAWNKIKNLGEKAWSGIYDFATKAWEGISNMAKDVFSFASDLFGSIGEIVMNAFRSVSGSIISIFSGIWTAIFRFFTSDLDGAIKALQNGFSNAFSIIVSFWQDTMNTIWAKSTEIFGNIANVINDIFGGNLTGIYEAFKKTFDAIGSYISGVLNNLSFSNFIDGLVGGLKNGLNGIISAWNNTVANLGFEIDLPDWMGGGKWGVNTYGWKIPTLASGTVTQPNDPFLAIVGDNTREKEVISPVSTIEEAVRNVIGENGTGQPIQIELSVNLDGRKIARGTYDYLYAEAKRRGEAWH